MKAMGCCTSSCACLIILRRLSGSALISDYVEISQFQLEFMTSTLSSVSVRDLVVGCNGSKRRGESSWVTNCLAVDSFFEHDLLHFLSFAAAMIVCVNKLI